MRAVPITAAVMGALGLTSCGGGGFPGGGRECETLVVDDTIQVFESDGKIMAMAKQDTQPKPYVVCLTLRATARDTQPKP